MKSVRLRNFPLTRLIIDFFLLLFFATHFPFHSDDRSLYRLMNKLLPGSVTRINTQGAQFKLMENINAFQTAAKRFGVPEMDVFQTVDLWERRNIPQVTQCIMALGRAVSIVL